MTHKPHTSDVAEAVLSSPVAPVAAKESAENNQNTTPPPVPAESLADSKQPAPEAGAAGTAGSEAAEKSGQSSNTAEEANGNMAGAMAFLRALILRGEREQKPDQTWFQTMREVARMASANTPRSENGNGGGPSNASSLFTAMDAPLHGLTPDDIRFAGEVDAALARRPRFGARALSVCVAVMFACLLVWAAFAEIDEVTHAEGQVVGSQRTQTIQNLEGGILRAVLVYEGQIVEKGDVLAQLDNELAESSFRDAVSKAMENSLALVRLEAELQGEPPVFPDNLEEWISGNLGRNADEKTLARATQLVVDQENSYRSRQNLLDAELNVLAAQYEQRLREVEEQEAHKARLEQSLTLAVRQRDTAAALLRRNNFSRMEFLNLEQKVVETQGQIDVLSASIPRAVAAADEARKRIDSRRAEQTSSITDEIRTRRLELNSLREMLSAGGDRVTRTELRAPVRGTVMRIYINTLGGVVKPGEPIMDLVPLDDTLLVEARVSPKDVAFLRAGQDVMVKVSAYDFSIYGGLPGKLESISADTIEDRRGDFYYLVRVRTQATSMVHNDVTLPIIPGMVVVADILIGKKTVLDYLLKPILKARQNALRER